MRPAPIIGGMTLIFALSLHAHAETVPYEATIAAPEVEVRSGPSPKFYATGKLHQGDRVKVLHKENEGAWLAIEPPPGSFSWINGRFIQRHGQSAQVHVDGEVPVRAGSQLTNEPPRTERFKATRGMQLAILDTRAVTAEDGSLWLAITPLPREERYIPADAVKPGVAPVVSMTSGPAGASAASLGPDDRRLHEAEQAERAGEVARAIHVYEELGRTTNDHNLSMSCYNRSQWLRESHPGLLAPGAQQPPAGGADGRLIPTPNCPYGQNTAGYSPPGQATSQYTYVQDCPQRPVPAQPASYSQNPPASQYSPPGWLRTTRGVVIDGKTAYVLETSQGVPIMYATAQPGVNLDPYVGRTVQLYGPVVYRGEVRTYYITVAQAVPR